MVIHKSSKLHREIQHLNGRLVALRGSCPNREKTHCLYSRYFGPTNNLNGHQNVRRLSIVENPLAKEVTTGQTDRWLRYILYLSINHVVVSSILVKEVSRAKSQSIL